MEVKGSDNKALSTETKVEETSTATTEVTKTTNEVKEENKLQLTHIDKDFAYDLFSVPSCSGFEYRMVTFIMLWAKRKNIKYEFDTYGNLYLTKGEIGENEFYPCVTAHLDTVQTKQKPYVLSGIRLDIETRISKGKHELYCDGFGPGGDDKCGLLIALSMFNHVDVLKAAFFLEEETGCRGSSSLNVEWFKNVGYVMGFDSPDLNRAAWSCSGTKLFTADFYKNHLQEICTKHGLTKFYSEPYTDVKQIREKTDITCMNFGSGYYNAHMANEYVVLEDIDTACRMGHDIIQHLGKKKYAMEKKSTTTTYYQGWTNTANDEDSKFLATLGGNSRYSSYGGRTTSSSSVSSVSGGTYSSTGAKKKDTDVSIETMKYIIERYEEYNDMIKNEIEAKCKELGINFDDNFAQIFNKDIKF